MQLATMHTSPESWKYTVLKGLSFMTPPAKVGISRMKITMQVVSTQVINIEIQMP